MEKSGNGVGIVLSRRGVDQNNTIRSIRARYPATGKIGVVDVSPHGDLGCGRSERTGRDHSGAGEQIDEFRLPNAGCSYDRNDEGISRALPGEEAFKWLECRLCEFRVDIGKKGVQVFGR
jgi:hypothetical protein